MRHSIHKLTRLALASLVAAGAFSLVATTAEAAVTQDQAAQTALARVPGATTDNLYIHPDYDDGRATFEGTIVYNNKEYEFEINASNGRFREWEAETRSGLGDRAGLISKAEAAQIALARVPGATTANLRIYLERDDGRYEFDGTIVKAGVKYDFEINATTGAIREWEVDGAASYPVYPSQPEPPYQPEQPYPSQPSQPNVDPSQPNQQTPVGPGQSGQPDPGPSDLSPTPTFDINALRSVVE
ncbi:MAG: PepSY domain-containing protein, partial [Propionibacteriaceae bacterium]|nr:PepSY domain-containing protein [Propionibacteriaceae bacterium]